MTLKSCALDVGVAFGTWFSKRNTVIDSRVSFGAHCIVGSCRIGEGTLLGSNVDILSGRHQHPIDMTEGRRDYKEGHFSQICIGSNAWIGNRVIVMADVGDDTVVGAGAVVVNSIPDRSLAVGNPAIVKRSIVRSPTELKRSVS